MELLYLLFSIISTSLTSFTVSLLLPLRHLLCRSPSAAVSLYEGVVWHERRRPVYHSFRYPVRYSLIDLDNVAHPPANHICGDEARAIAGTNGAVFLLTIPPSVGYEQNPLSLYYCYDTEDCTSTLKMCIAEVTNTPWGERVSFLFNPNSDLVAKALHVSPFMDMQGTWRIKATAPGDDLSVIILVNHPDHGDFFTATLMAKRVPSSAVSDHSAFFWLMPHKVAFWIYWHALKLWWKNVQFMQHPRYGNPAYREEALVHDRNLKHSMTDENFTNNPFEKDYGNVTARWFEWRDARWPWS